MSKEIRALIFQMLAENPTWDDTPHSWRVADAGLRFTEQTVSRWVRRAPRPPQLSKRWLTFLRNYREAIAAMDFFTAPTLTFGILCCFFLIGHTVVESFTSTLRTIPMLSGSDCSCTRPGNTASRRSVS